MIPLLLFQVFLACDPECTVITKDKEIEYNKPRRHLRVQKKMIYTPATSAELQTALTNSVGGDEIHLTAGVTYTGSFNLTAKSSVVTIRTANMAWSTAGNRVRPSDISSMAKLQSAGIDPVFNLGADVDNWKFLGLAITSASSVYTFNVLQIGDLDGVTDITTLPNNITVERCYIFNSNLTQGSRRGVLAMGTNITIKDSHIEGFFDTGADTQAIGIFGGQGPFLVENNFLEGAGENIFIGTEMPLLQGERPQNITIRRNYVLKRASWQTSGYVLKNLLEIKSGSNILIERNIFENNWALSQSGYGILFTARNGTLPQVNGVTFRFNKLINIANGFNVLGKNGDGAITDIGRVFDILIEDNLVEGPTGRAFQFLNAIETIIVRRNTVLGNTQSIWLSDMQQNGSLIFNDNAVGYGQFGIHHSGVGDGLASIQAGWATSSLNGNYAFPAPCCGQVYPGFTFVANVGLVPSTVGVNRTTLDTNLTGVLTGQTTSSQTTPPIIAEGGFTSNIVTGPYKTIQSGHNMGAISTVQSYGLHQIGSTLYQIAVHIDVNELGVAQPNVRDEVQHLAARLAAFKSEDGGLNWTFVNFGPFIRSYHHGTVTGGLGFYAPDNTFYHDYIASVVDGNTIKIFCTDGAVLSSELIPGVLVCINFDGTNFSTLATSNFNPFPICQGMAGYTDVGVYETLIDRWYDYSIGQEFTKVQGGGTVPFLYIGLQEDIGSINAARMSNGHFLITFRHKFSLADINRYAYYSEFDGASFTTPAKIEPADISSSRVETLVSDNVNNSIYGTYRRGFPDSGEKRHLIQFQGDALSISPLQFLNDGLTFPSSSVNLTYIENGVLHIIIEGTAGASGPQIRFANVGPIPVTLQSPGNPVTSTTTISGGTFIDGIVCRPNPCFVAFAYVRIGTSSMGTYRVQSNPGGGWFTWQNIVNFANATARSGVTWLKLPTKALSSCNINAPAQLRQIQSNGVLSIQGIDFASLDIIPHATCGTASVNLTRAVADQMFMFDSVAIAVQTVAGPPPPTGVPTGCPDIEVDSVYCRPIKVVDDSSPLEVSCDDPIYTEDGSQPC